MIPLQTNKPILSIGDACPDIILPYSDTLAVMAALARGETINAEQKSARIAAGGSVANTAHGIAVLGGKSWFAGKVGNDYFGRFLKDAFDRAGVDTRFLILDEKVPTSMVIAVMGQDKNRVTYAVPRTQASQHQLAPSDLPENLLDQIGWLHTSGILLRENPAADTILDLMEQCAQKSIPVSLDLNIRIEAIGDATSFERINRAIEYSNILFGSGKDELSLVTGGLSPQAAATALVGSNRVVVCRSGSSGTNVYELESHVSHCSAFDVPVVDTLGAGDAYNAGFITAAAQGLGLEIANLYGNAVAGYKLMHAGARNFPNQRQLEQFFRDHDGKYVEN